MVHGGIDSQELCTSQMVHKEGDLNYQEFIEAKSQIGWNHGFKPLWMPDFLKDFQQYLTAWGIERGRGLIASDCGTGKTPMQLVWAENVVRHTNKPVLILTPLAVSFQTVHEAEKFDIEAHRSHDGKPMPNITVTNYEQLHRFDWRDYGGVVCDECFPPDTLIDVFNIDNVLTRRYIKDIRSGDKILNANGEDNVQNIYKRRINRAVKICIDGYYVTCSENHPWFTMYGWRSAQDLRAGDYLMATREAMRLVRRDIRPEVCSSENGEVLRSILLSEMADEHSRAQSESPYTGSCEEAGGSQIQMVQEWRPESGQRISTDSEFESDGQPRVAGEDGIYFAREEAQTFRAWGKWTPNDLATAENDGCIIRQLDTGICYITGETGTRFSNMLQSGLRQSRLEDCDRGGRPYSSESQESGCEKGYEARYFRVDSIEILELGHPDLDRYRDENGDIYFYDIKATRHPSFSVHGCLVHNSSILKNFDGKRKTEITQFMRKIPYRLLATATAAPNDFTELGTSSEALGGLGYTDMLMKFFKNDQNVIKPMVYRNRGQNFMNHEDGAKWRLKGHAEIPFWRWVASWSRALRKPSDFGFDDKEFTLPPLIENEHLVKASKLAEGMLFELPAFGLREQREESRRSIEDRCNKVAELVNTGQSALIWCHLNDEGDYLEKIIPDAKQVSGKDSDEAKEEKFMAFVSGQIRVLITKPKIGCLGLNLQNCNHVTFFPTHSYEQFYQGVRRCWRFGQKRPVTVDIVTTEGGQGIMKNLQRKSEQADKMFTALVAQMNNAMTIDERAKFNKSLEVPKWLV